MRTPFWTLSLVLAAITACSSDDGAKLNGDIAHLASPGVAAVTRNADSADKLGEVAEHDEGERA